MAVIGGSTPSYSTINISGAVFPVTNSNQIGTGAMWVTLPAGGNWLVFSCNGYNSYDQTPKSIGFSFLAGGTRLFTTNQNSTYGSSVTLTISYIDAWRIA